MVKVVGRGEVLGMKKKTSTTSKNNSNSQLYATATNIKTGEKKYLVNGKLVDTKPTPSSRGRSTPISNTVISKEGKITMTDLNKGLLFSIFSFNFVFIHFLLIFLFVFINKENSY